MDQVAKATNDLESINAQLRKISSRPAATFRVRKAATKLILLALRNITAEWSRPTHGWKSAMNQFAILYEDRFTRGVS